MAAVMPRVQVPSSVPKREVFQIKALISHRMETGLRRSYEGNIIPRDIINKFVCRYNGADVFVVDLHEAVAANPYFEFYLRATEGGRLEFVWQEDGGHVYALAHQITVT